VIVAGVSIRHDRPNPAVPLSFVVVYTAIPDRWIPLAENAAAAICAQTGGSYDWEFYDAERVRYVFTSLKAGDAFRAHCALMGPLGAIADTYPSRRVLTRICYVGRP
jgi:hypothetical protein